MGRFHVEIKENDFLIQLQRLAPRGHKPVPSGGQARPRKCPHFLRAWANSGMPIQCPAGPVLCWSGLPKALPHFVKEV
ncbi:hypothetical protein DRW41_21870 [Neobacillus piezotolerans]|uniref:Uncharacterized protein n=1 Tax=Neobacillus piezotolerans TaxID=2259171 RepID=A0A3D8GKW5_9BACI|nr:hypothetical protein DRW41_21870 [Neobacillus piezotolerans]